MESLYDSGRMIRARESGKTIICIHGFKAPKDAEPVIWNGFTLQRLHVYGYSPYICSRGNFTGDFVVHSLHNKMLHIYVAKRKGVTMSKKSEAMCLMDKKRTDSPQERAENRDEWVMIELPAETKFAKAIIAALEKRREAGNFKLYDRCVGAPRERQVNYNYI